MMKNIDSTGAEINVGDVVRYADRRRTYRVACFDCTGSIYMVALSGAMAGSCPSTVRPSDLVKLPGADTTFRGSIAGYLANRYRNGVAMGASLAAHRASNP